MKPRVCFPKLQSILENVRRSFYHVLAGLPLTISETASQRIPYCEAGLPEQVQKCLEDDGASLELSRQAARAIANLVIDEGQPESLPRCAYEKLTGGLLDSVRETVWSTGYISKVSSRMAGTLREGWLPFKAVPFAQAAAVSLLNLSMGEIGE